MNWTYDTSVRALYVSFGGTSHRQVELAPGVIADLDAAGALVGLEVLSWDAVDVGEIARRYGLDEQTAQVLDRIVFQPVTGYRLVGPGEASPRPVDETIRPADDTSPRVDTDSTSQSVLAAV